MSPDAILGAASGPWGVVDAGEWEPAIAHVLLFDPSDSRKTQVAESDEVTNCTNLRVTNED